MKKLLVFMFVFLLPMTTFGSYKEVNNSIRNAYSKIYYKVYNDNKSDKGLAFLKSLRTILENFSNSNKVNSKNSLIISDLQKLNNEKIFSLEQENEREEAETIFKKNSLLKNFKHKLYDSKNHIFLENGVWYYYDIGKVVFFEENISKINKDDLFGNGLNYDNSLVFLDKGKVYFSNNYKKFKLVKDDLLFGFPNKKYVLDLFKKYSFRTKKDVNLDSELLEIKNKTKEITKLAYKDEDKIEKIYNFILENTSYATNYTFENPDFFSGIKTYKNKSGVCEGYTELFILMLAYSMIDSKMVTGDVINVADFGKIGHAWIQIGDYFYDPTFDDPTGAEKTRKKSEYVYFKLPRDLFYTNRFNTGYTPKSLKGTDADYRDKLVRNNLVKVYDKYKNNNYNVLNELKFRKENNLDLLKVLDLNDIIKATGGAYKTDLKTVKIDGKTKYFNKILYFKVEDETGYINAFLKSINYNLTGYKVFNVSKDGENFYAFSNEYSFR